MIIEFSCIYRRAIIGGLVLISPLLAPISQTVAEMPSQEEMWKMIQQQQQEIKELKNQQKVTDEKTDAVTEVVESQASNTSNDNDAPGWWKNTQIGGYGELHYNGGDKDEIDFHRFVIEISHQFNDRIRLFTEWELEHAISGDDEEGEVELEQAYIEFDLTEEHQARAGVFLLPVGIMNEHHEPTTFFGVERNPVESNIIPTTWWEAGVGVSGELPANFQYDLAFHSGLETPIDGSNAFKIRNGRQKASKASAKDGAVTAALNWNGIAGVKLGASAQYQNDITQRTQAEDVSAVLLATNADIRKGPLGLRAVYAHWSLDGSTVDAVGRDQQAGWYVEPAYYIDTPAGDVGIFGRYNQYDNEAGNSADTEYEQIDVGLNFWPHQNVVLKVDMAFVDAPAGGMDDEILNLGVGFNY